MRYFFLGLLWVIVAVMAWDYFNPPQHVDPPGLQIHIVP